MIQSRTIRYTGCHFSLGSFNLEHLSICPFLTWLVGCLFLVFKFWNDYRFTGSCKNTTERSHIAFPQLPPLLASLLQKYRTHRLCTLIPVIRDFAVNWQVEAQESQGTGEVWGLPARESLVCLGGCLFYSVQAYSSLDISLVQIGSRLASCPGPCL